MKMFGLKTVLAAGAIALLGGQAGATTTSLTCPGDGLIVQDELGNDVVRYLDLGWDGSLDVSVSCLDWGSQTYDPDAKGQPDTEAAADKAFMDANPGWVQIGKNQSDTPNGLAGYVSYAAGTLWGATSGSFTLTNVGDYDTYALLWKFGEPHVIASWMAVQFTFGELESFLLNWAGVDCVQNEGGVECSGTQNALSHLSLYGKDVPQVPLPAGGLLLLTALGGMALVRRRKMVAA